MKNIDFMSYAILEAEKAFSKGEVPIGAIVVKNNRIIGKGHNLKEKKQSVTRHAEIIAIEKACKKIKNWHLDSCEIYITLEPCMMCCGAILQSRIGKVIYCLGNEKFGYLEKNEGFDFSVETDKLVVEKITDNRSLELLQKFFEKKRFKKDNI